MPGMRHWQALYNLGGLSNVTCPNSAATTRSLSMLVRKLAVTMFALALLFAGTQSMAQEQNIPLPKLPEGAGKADADAPLAFTKTPSGLQYRILRKGAGGKPKATDKVKVNYHGWLDDGKVFDSSYQRREPISFGLNQVIRGWTEGMQLVGEGGMIELW